MYVNLLWQFQHCTLFPHDIMYLWRSCCRIVHLMSNTCELPEIGCLLGFKSILCAGQWSVRRLFVTSITSVLLAAWHGMLSFANIISRLKRIWGKRTDRMTSFGCHIAFMFPWMRTTIILCILTRLCAICYAHFCHIKCFSYKTIHEESFPTKKTITTSPCTRSPSA